MCVHLFCKLSVSPSIFVGITEYLVDRFIKLGFKFLDYFQLILKVPTERTPCASCTFKPVFGIAFTVNDTTRILIAFLIFICVPPDRTII